MKILQVVPFFSPVHGGSATVPYYLSKELAKRGHEVAIFTSDYELSREWVQSLHQVKVYPFKTHLSWIKFYVTPSILKHAREGIKHFDLVHMHNYRSFQNVVVYHYVRKYGVPYVLQAHGSLPRIMAKQKLKWIFDVLFGYGLLRNASKVVALNQTEAQQYRGAGVPDEKIAIIPNGIDLTEYADLPPKGSFKKKFGIDEDERIVLYLGRIHKSKGLDLLADAFSDVSRNVRNVRLVVVGPDDGYAATLSRRISDLRIGEKVLLTGFVEKRDKLAALIDSDVFVTPRFYGFPVTFLEACLAQCPIITTSDELDWIHDNVGYVVEDSPIALAKAISNILQDKVTRERFKKNCKSAIKNFDISTVVSQLEDTYKSVME